MAGLALGGMTIALAGCAKDPPPFDPHALTSGELSGATQATSRPMPPLPTTLESAYLPPAPEDRRPAEGREMAGTRPTSGPTTGPSIYDNSARLPLQNLVQLAVMHNPEVRVAGYNPAINETRVTEEQARFDPSWVSKAGYEYRNAQTGGSTIFVPQSGSPFGGQNQTIFTDRQDIYSASTGIRQILESGGQYELRYEYASTSSKPQRTINDPYREHALVLELTQPLLQNFGTEINAARIRVARNNQRISLLDLRTTVEEQISKLEQAYWQLYQRERSAQIQEALLARTSETARILGERLRGGVDVSRVQTAQAESAVEQRRAELIRAKADVQDTSDQIKRLVNDPDMPVSSSITILAGTPPVDEPVRFDLTDLINTALEHRPELAQQQMRINTAGIAARVGKNALLPELNLTGQFRSNGDDPGEPFQGKYFSTRLGLELIIPIGNRQARAQWTRTLLQRQQAIEQYRQLVEQVSLEVKQAERNVYTSWLEMVAQRRARFSAADALLAVEQRQAAQEPLTPTFVQLILDRQRELAAAEQNEAQAIANYNVSIADLERRKGTLLRYNNVVLDEDSMPFARRLYGERHEQANP